MAAAVRRGDASKSRRDCAVAARELVQGAAFVQLCRRKQLSPHAALLRPQGDGSSGVHPPIDSRAWQAALSRLDGIDTAPDILARIH